MTQFINNKEDVVTEAIDGAIRASGGTLIRLDGYPHIKVVTRKQIDRSKVALVSGGGSGHEPAHAGFVGTGMLTAAVCGEVFASPSVDAVLAGILAVTGDAGCLLIVKNYTGDRLNFGLAAERARTFGKKVEIVIVDDDIALPDIAQPRGLAATLFVHKIAGALAEQGASLEDVTAAARKVTEGSISLGMSLDTCTVPGSPKDDRISVGKAELGLGIHGEAGVEQVDFLSAIAAMHMVVEKLQARMAAGPHVVLLNNLGGTSALEMSVLAYELANSSIAERIALMIGPAVLMSSLDMRGFSVSLCPVDEHSSSLLCSPAPLSAWPGCYSLAAVDTVPLPDGLTLNKYSASAHPETAAMLTTCCEVFIEAEAALNALDAQSGDGDTGSTLAGAAKALIHSMGQLPLADHTQLFRAIGQELSQTMGGSSGVLLAIMLTAAGDAASSGKNTRDSLIAGLKRMQQIGGAKQGDRTMVDAMVPALDALSTGLAAAAAAARKGADYTATLDKANAGRSTYVNADRLHGHNDPGAEAVALLFERLAN